jgi:Ribonuclease G/E
VQVAAVVAGVLTDYALWRPGAPDGVGDVHRGRVSARAPAMAGAFVALAGDVSGFLPDSAGAKGLTEGDAVRVRIVRAAQGGKGPRLLAEARDAGPPALLRRGPTPVERLLALHVGADVLTDDPSLAPELSRMLGRRVAVSGEMLDDDLAAQIETLGRAEVTLRSGARLTVTPTPALVAIDVDAGAAAGSLASVNRAALPEIARQIRLRNLSGAIVVDLAGMSPRGRGALGPDLSAALAGDPIGPRFLGFTALGLAEIVRPRVHPPLHELHAGPHAAGLAALRAAASSGSNVALRASPQVAEALQADPAALDGLARRTGRALMLRSDPTLTAWGWRLEAT